MTHSEAETAAAGRDLAQTLTEGSIVMLIGDLGAGKTAFVRGMAEGLGVDPGDVSSPTFTLVHEYRGGRLTLVHIDLYRLQDPREIDDLGIEDLEVGRVVAIEWADRLPRSPRGAIRVSIADEGEDSRRVTVETDA